MRKKIFKQKGYNITVIDNYLTELDLRNVLGRVHLKEVKYAWQKQLNANARKEWQFQFTDSHVWRYVAIYPGSDYIPLIVLNPHAMEVGAPLKVWRSRTNIFIKTKTFPFSLFDRGMGYHRDVEDSPHMHTLLLYLEDSDGGTQFKDNGRIIRSKRNRAVIFPAHKMHQTIMQTNSLYRTNVNINFEYS
tara:strand:- start:192 stop:758 length:567 start_codon:yes stop_codon:yes gene_type:complete